jgi:hypothetical protein
LEALKVWERIRAEVLASKAASLNKDRNAAQLGTTNGDSETGARRPVWRGRLGKQLESGETQRPTVPSIDFRSVRWFGKEYTFTANQALVVKVLWQHWEAGTPDVGDETLLEAVDREAPPARLDVLFRKHPAWRVMVVPGETKGTHRLAEPEKNI